MNAKKCRIERRGSETPLGTQVVAVDVATGAVVAESFGWWIAEKVAKSQGYEIVNPDMHSQ